MMMNIMHNSSRWAPNRARFIWDFFSAMVVSIFVLGYYGLFLNLPVPLILIGSPILVILFNVLFGIYSRYRIGSGFLKGTIFAISLIFSGLVMLALGATLAPILLWAFILWPILSLPRIFLNIRHQNPVGLLDKVVKQRGPVLVVGGGGYIGTHVVEQLLEEGYSVRVLDRFMYGKESLKNFIGKIEIVEGDATDIQKLMQAMDGASSVVHLAGIVGDPACAVDEQFTRHANIISTRMVKDVAISFGVSRFIFASSCSVYGSSDNEVDESSSLNPLSLYAQTKIDSEQELLHCQADSFSVTILRFATIFGHSHRPRFDLVANLFTAQAMNNGSVRVIGPQQWRPFVHVSDLARAVVLVLGASPKTISGQIFNVGDRCLNMTIGELGKKVAGIVSKERPVTITVEDNPADRRNYSVSFEKIRKMLGFEAKVLLEPGIQEIVNEFKKGTYSDFKDSRYNNVAVTKKAAEDFRDPLQVMNLYQPINEQRRQVIL